MSFNPKASFHQLRASDPEASVWVNANAGSGKTHVLVDRVVRLMLGGTEPSKIMCLTFTKAAAAEMANRLFERLSTWIAMDDQALRRKLEELGSPHASQALMERARQLFTRALETPGGLKIQTIHAFCERVLQLFPVEAGVVPHFTLLDDRQSADLLDRARNAVLREAKSDSASPLSKALLDVANRLNPDAFDSLLTQLISKRSELRSVFDEDTGIGSASAHLRQYLSLADDVTADGLRSSLTVDKQRYLDLAAALETGSDADRKRASGIRIACARDPFTLLDLRSILLTTEGEPRKALAIKKVLAQHNWISEFALREQARLIDALGKQGDLDCLNGTLAALRLGGAIVKAFEDAKRRNGCYDFDDLIIKTGELLAERPDAAWVLYKLDGGIEHLLVDEAQDTSPRQWQIVRRLTEEFFAGEGRHGKKQRTVFVVGDRKQSIYSFQGADPDVFETIHDEFQSEIVSAGSDFRDVDFTVSFRSAPEILKAVDTVFDPASAFRQGLDGLKPRDWVHESNRAGEQGTVEIWPLVKPEDAAEEDPWQAPVDREPASSPRRRLARQLARTIKGWVGRKLLVSHGRAVVPGDILILVQRRDAFFDAMIRALWNEQVPVAGADRLKLSENIAVLDLMALAQFCIMPEDDHALACLLKSPVLPQSFSEDDLLAIAANRNTLTLWQSLEAREGEPFASAVRLLKPLIARAPSARPFEFLSAILTHARLRFVSRLGSEANDAIDALLDRALDHEEQNGTSLAGFVNWFQAGESEIKREMQQGANEVRIMTVHGAKGLEAPIVILPDTASDPAKGRSSPLLMLAAGNGDDKVPFWPVPKSFVSERLQALKDHQKSREAHEKLRLLYVAMTRARDELYVCGYEGKTKLAGTCWYEIVRNALAPHMTEVPELGGWRLGAAPAWRDAEAAAMAAELAGLPAWATAVLAAAEDAVPSPAPRVKRARERVARGILVHRILQQLPELEDGARAGYVATAVRRAGADPSLAAELLERLAHPDLAELLTADGLSEVPLIARLPDGSQERRRIDRLVISDGVILIADYKTDREVPETPDACNPEYLSQMAAYRAALRLIHPGVPVRLCLVWTEAPRLMHLPDSLLDSMAAVNAAPS